jgi:hypothetical protein
MTHLTACSTCPQNRWWKPWKNMEHNFWNLKFSYNIAKQYYLSTRTYYHTSLNLCTIVAWQVQHHFSVEMNILFLKIPCWKIKYFRILWRILYFLHTQKNNLKISTFLKKIKWGVISVKGARVLQYSEVMYHAGQVSIKVSLGYHI